MQVQNVLRGTQQAEAHTQVLETKGPGGATTHVPPLDCAPLLAICERLVEIRCDERKQLAAIVITKGF